MINSSNRGNIVFLNVFFLCFLVFFTFGSSVVEGQIFTKGAEVQFWIASVANQIQQIQMLLKSIEQQEKVFRTLAEGGFDNFLLALQMQSQNVARVSVAVSNYSSLVDEINLRKAEQLDNLIELEDASKNSVEMINSIAKLKKIRANIEVRKALRENLRNMEEASYAMNDLAFRTQQFVDGEKQRAKNWEYIFDNINNVESPTAAAQLTSQGLYNISGQLSDLLAITRVVNQASTLDEKIKKEKEAQALLEEEVMTDAEKELFEEPDFSQEVESVKSYVLPGIVDGLRIADEERGK